MVHLTPKFALLAAIVVFSAFSDNFEVNAVAIPRSTNGNVVLPRHAQITGPHHVARHSKPAASDDDESSEPAPAKSGKGGKKSPHRSATPQLVLPVLATKKGKASKGGKKNAATKGGKKNKHAEDDVDDVEEDEKHGRGHRGGRHDKGGKHDKGGRHHQRMLYDEDSSLVRIGPLDIISGDHVYNKHHRVHDAKPLLSVGKRSEEGVPGTIDIMSASAGGPPHRIAQMYLNRTSADSAFVLDASDRNFTQFYMVHLPLNGTEPRSGEDKPVSLKLPVFNSTAAAMTDYCVCFDPRASSPEPMTMAPCFESASQSTDHQSQTFSYSPSTGTIRPMWFNGEDDGKAEADGFSSSSVGPDDSGEDLVDPITPESADIASVTSLDDGSSSNSTLANTTSSTNGTRWASSMEGAIAGRDVSRQAQNVTLIFTPSTPEVKAEAFSSSLPSSSVAVPTSTNVDSTSSSVAPEASALENVEASSTAPASTAVVTATTTTTTSETATTTMTLVQISESPSPSSSTSASNVEAQDFAAVSSTVTAYSTTFVTEYVSSTESQQPTVTAFSTVTAAAPSSTSSINADAIAERIAAGAFDASALPGDFTAETIDSLVWDFDESSTSDSSFPEATNVMAAEAAPASSAASPSMTPVSTAPYEWMFTPDSRL